jgi:hypothetical protein
MIAIQSGLGMQRTLSTGVNNAPPTISRLPDPFGTTPSDPPAAQGVIMLPVETGLWTCPRRLLSENVRFRPPVNDLS